MPLHIYVGVTAIDPQSRIEKLESFIPGCIFHFSIYLENLANPAIVIYMGES